MGALDLGASFQEFILWNGFKHFLEVGEAVSAVESKTLLEMKVTTRGTPVQVCDRFLSYFKAGTRGDGGSSKLLFHLIIALIVLVFKGLLYPPVQQVAP